MPGDESDLSPLRQDAARMRDATMSGRDAYTASGNIYINQAPPQPAPPPAPAPGRGSGARAGGTGTDADSRGGGQAGLKSRMQRPELGFLGSPLGMTAAAVALIIVAICAFLAGRQSSGRWKIWR